MDGSGGSGSTIRVFHSLYFFPKWVAVSVPLMARQRQEAKKNEEEEKIWQEEESQRIPY